MSSKRASYHFSSFRDEEQLSEAPSAREKSAPKPKKSRKFVFDGITDEESRSIGKQNQLSDYRTASQTIRQPAQPYYQTTDSVLIASNSTVMKSMPAESVLMAPNDSKVSAEEKAEEERYAEALLMKISTPEKMRELESLIRQQASQTPLEKHQLQTLLFLSLEALLHYDSGFTCLDKFKRLERTADGTWEQWLSSWVLFMLHSQIIPRDCLTPPKSHRNLVYLCMDDIDELTDRLMANGNFEDAFVASNMKNKTFMNDVRSKQLKRECDLINGQDLRIVPRMAWPLTLSFALLYFQEDTTESYIKYIFSSYQRSNYLMPCELFLLGFFLEGESTQLVKQSDVMRHLEGHKQLSLLELVKIMYLLKSRKQRFRKAFDLVLKKILSRIRNPALFIHLYDIEAFKVKQASDYLLFYMRENISIQNDPKIMKLMDYEINDRHIIRGEDEELTTVIYPWKQSQTLLKLHQQGKHTHLLEFYVKQHSTLTKMTTMDYGDILEIIRKTITRFEVACSYRREEKSKYYCLLQEMKRLIKHSSTLRLIQGCIWFVQLKNGINVLTGNDCVQTLDHLNSYLNNQPDSDYHRFARCLNMTLKRLLMSSEGYVYLTALRDTSSILLRKKAAQSLSTSPSQPQQNESVWWKLARLTGHDEQVRSRLLVRMLVG